MFVIFSGVYQSTESLFDPDARPVRVLSPGLPRVRFKHGLRRGDRSYWFRRGGGRRVTPSSPPTRGRFSVFLRRPPKVNQKRNIIISREKDTSVLICDKSSCLFVNDIFYSVTNTNS